MKRALATLLLLTATRPLYANPVDAFGFGSRAPAMGGAQVAASEDASANFYNPAGLVVGRELRIDLGYRYAQPILRMGGHDVGVDASRGFSLGIAAPGAIGPFRFAFGVALWLPDQRLTRVRTLPFAQPRFVYYDNRMQRLDFAANLAIQIVNGLYVGGGVVFMSRTQGQVLLRGDVAVSDPDLSSLTTSVDVDLVAVRYFQAGLRWDARPYLSLGALFRQEFALGIDQQLRIDGNLGDPGLPPIVSGGSVQVRAISTDLFDPMQLTVGAAVRPTRRSQVTFDLTWARWSAFPEPAAHLTLQVDVGVFNSRVHLPPSRSFPPAGFRDILIPRIGAEWRCFEVERVALVARAGYSYEPTPVPDQLGESNFADADKHTVSIGAGVELRRLGPILAHPLTLDVHAALTVLPPRTTRKIDPLDRVGDFVSDGLIPQVGMTLRSRF